MNKEEIKKWEEFVVEELCPAQCGHLRFKVKRLIKEMLQAHDKEIIEKIKKMVKYRDLDRGGYNQALNDVLKVI